MSQEIPRSYATNSWATPRGNGKSTMACSLAKKFTSPFLQVSHSDISKTLNALGCVSGLSDYFSTALIPCSRGQSMTLLREGLAISANENLGCVQSITSTKCDKTLIVYFLQKTSSLKTIQIIIVNTSTDPWAISVLGSKSKLGRIVYVASPD